MDDNPLDCLLRKLNIVRVNPNVSLVEFSVFPEHLCCFIVFFVTLSSNLYLLLSLQLDLDAKLSIIPDCDYYYDMLYLLPYSTYIKPPPGTSLLVLICKYSCVCSSF